VNADVRYSIGHTDRPTSRSVTQKVKGVRVGTQRVRNLTLLATASLTILAATVIAPSLPGMAIFFEDTPNSEFLVRLSLTIPALFAAIGAPIAGLLLDRVGRRPVLITATTLFGLVGTLGFFADSLMTILISRAVLGIAVAGVMTSVLSLIADYFSGSDRDRFMGYQGAAIGLGGAVFVFTAGYLAEVGWQFPFLIHAIALLVLPAMILTMNEPKPLAAPEKQDAEIDKRLPLAALMPIYIVAFVTMLLLFVFPVLLPEYLAGRGFAGGQIGLALSLQTLISVVVALQFYRVKARLSYQGIFAIILGSLAINFGIVGFEPSFVIIVMAMLLGGLGLGLLAPNIGVWVASLTSSANRGRAMGGLTMAIFLGQFATPIAVQPLVASSGIVSAFIVAGSVSLLLAVLFVFWSKSR